MRRAFAWAGGAFGAAALLRLLRRRGGEAGAPPEDRAAELRRRLAEAREASDDRDEFDAAEGVPVDMVPGGTPGEQPGAGRSVEERRREVHGQGQDALEQMRGEAGARDD